AGDHADVPVLGDLLPVRQAAGVGRGGGVVHAALPPGGDHPRHGHGTGGAPDPHPHRLARGRHRALVPDPRASVACEAGSMSVAMRSAAWITPIALVGTFLLTAPASGPASAARHRLSRPNIRDDRIPYGATRKHEMAGYA